MAKRIALQLFGHLRTWDKTYKNLFKYVIEPNKAKGYEIDIFIHTWDELEHTEPRSWYNKDKKISGKKLTQKQISIIKKKYAPKKMLIESQLLPTQGYNDKRGKNIAHTFYQCNKLREEYEKENSINYDLVIVTRPDIKFLFPLQLDRVFEDFTVEELKNTVLYSDIPNLVHNVNYNINNRQFIVGCDLFLIGGCEVISTIAEKWYLEKRYLIEERPEWNIAQIIFNQNIYLNLFQYPNNYCWDIKRTKEYVDNILIKPVLFLLDIISSILHNIFIFCPEYRRRCFLGQVDSCRYYHNLYRNLKKGIKNKLRLFIAKFGELTRSLTGVYTGNRSQ